MILTDAARLQAEADLFDQHRLRITLGAHGPLLGTDGEHFLDLADPRLDLGDILARILFHLTTPGRDRSVTRRRRPSVGSIRQHRECRTGSARRYTPKAAHRAAANTRRT